MIELIKPIFNYIQQEFANWFIEDLPLSIKVITGGHTKRQIMNPVFEENDIIIATIGALSKLTTTGMIYYIIYGNSFF